MKSHACCFRNEIWDECAETGLSDADPICQWAQQIWPPSKTTYVLKWWKTLANLLFLSPLMKLPINRFYDRLFFLTSYEHMIFLNIFFTNKVLAQPHGVVVHSVTASCQNSLVAYWVKAMTGSLQWQHICTQSIRQNTLLSALNFSQQSQDGCEKEKIFRIFSAPPPNFTMLGQQLSIKFVRLNKTLDWWKLQRIHWKNSGGKSCSWMSQTI